jgi:hypothetical protein
LHVLGVFNCDAGHLRTFPADTVHGDGNEEQLLNALYASLDKPDLACAVLNEVYSMYRFGPAQPDVVQLCCHEQVTCVHAFTGVYIAPCFQALRLVLMAMCKWKRHSALQIAASAGVFYVVKTLDKKLPSALRRHTVVALMNGVCTRAVRAHT